MGPFNIRCGTSSASRSPSPASPAAIMLHTTMFGLAVRRLGGLRRSPADGREGQPGDLGRRLRRSARPSPARCGWFAAARRSARMGAEPLLKAVIAAIIGGLGSLPAPWWAVCRSASPVFFRSWLPSDLQGLTDSAVFVVIAVLFVVRPQRSVRRRDGGAGVMTGTTASAATAPSRPTPASMRRLALASFRRQPRPAARGVRRWPAVRVVRQFRA
ncbi:MAG: hypothetical protein R2713_06545 [Ilumatobacteraceae bacterium]